jgi:hypothetical protein
MYESSTFRIAARLKQPSVSVTLRKLHSPADRESEINFVHGFPYYVLSKRIGRSSAILMCSLRIYRKLGKSLIFMSSDASNLLTVKKNCHLSNTIENVAVPYHI